MFNIIETINKINFDWKDILITILNDKEYLNELENFLNKEEETYKEFLNILPPKNMIFNCFNHFHFNDLKIVILGQDPYPTKGNAMGLSFSIPKDIKLPPSLKRIYKEIEDDLEINMSSNGDLTSWANQGILLLNTSLTVRESKPNSHSKIWKKFTKSLIEYINKNSNKVIFLMWGNNAKSYKTLIDLNRHICLEARHPSPLARKGWFGCKHFSKTNKLLSENGKKEIIWKL